MATYVPGTGEVDLKKYAMSLQQIGPKIDALQIPGTGLKFSGGSLATSLSALTAAIGADVSMTNTTSYFDGPAIAQGTAGTWLVFGSIVVLDSSTTAGLGVKLWDGTTVIDSSAVTTPAANFPVTMTVAGIITSPAGNLRISCRNFSSTNGVIKFNSSGNAKDSNITAVRIA
jgi:hypothetical protein